MSWKTFKKRFDLSMIVKFTSTKLLAWVMLIFTWDTFDSIPNEAKAFYGISMIGIIAALYTGKNIHDYLVNKGGKDVR